jgi:small-conductance mechanosensitive channel
MMDNNSNRRDLVGRSAYFRDIRYFSIIVFMVSLMAAAIINTQAEMKQIADLLAFLGLGYLVIGIAAQLIRVNQDGKIKK